MNVTEIVQVAPADNVFGDNGQVEVCEKSPEVETLEIVNGTVWLFFRVTPLGALVVPIPWGAKPRLAGNKLTGAVPVPLNVAVCGEFEALSLTVSIPVLAPRAVGVNVTEILQLAPAASVFGASGHFEVCPKSPETEILLIVSGTDWVLLRMTFSALLVVCTTQFPKETLVGVRV